MQQWRNYHVAKEAVLVLQDVHLHDEREHKSFTTARCATISYLHFGPLRFQLPYCMIRPAAGSVVCPAHKQKKFMQLHGHSLKR
jgi:hypothetical protein